MSYSGNFYADLHAAQYQAAAEFEAEVERQWDDAQAAVYADRGAMTEVFSEQSDLLAIALQVFAKSKRTDADRIAFAEAVWTHADNYLRPFVRSTAEKLACDALDEDEARRAA